MMTLKEYIAGRIPSYEKEGLLHLPKFAREVLDQDNLTLDDLREMVVECKAERDRHVRFSMKYQYYWSLMGGVEDIVISYARDVLEKSEKSC